MTLTSWTLNVVSGSGPNNNGPQWQIKSEGVNGGFNEGSKYRIEMPVVGAQFLIDDQPLEDDNGHWKWTPGFYAGRVHAELLIGQGQVAASFALDVAPHTEKLSSDIFQSMLDQIWHFDPRLVLGTEPPRFQTGHQARITNPWLEYARLRSYGAKFVRSLGAIARYPIRELRAERALLPLRYVRRTDRQTALGATRIPSLLATLKGRESALPSTEALPLLDVPVTEETLDAAANRCIAMMTHAIAHRVVQLKETLELEIRREVSSATRSDLAARWPRRREFLDRLVRQLRQAQRVSPIKDVTRREFSAAGLNAVSADPTYSRTYGLAWRILRHGVEGAPDSVQLWICPTWEIYERWCFVRMAEALQANRPDYCWSMAMGHKSSAKLALVGFRGDDCRVELLLQPEFPAGDANSKSGFHSISGAREPDIVATFREGNQQRWCVFDAKYRTTRKNVLDAMSSAHIYRDALRWHQRKPESAVILVPRSGGAPWMEEWSFIRTHRVGVCAMSTDTDVAEIFDNLAVNCF